MITTWKPSAARKTATLTPIVVFPTPPLRSAIMNVINLRTMNAITGSNVPWSTILLLLIVTELFSCHCTGKKVIAQENSRVIAVFSGYCVRGHNFGRALIAEVVSTDTIGGAVTTGNPVSADTTKGLMNYKLSRMSGEEPTM